VRGRRGQYRTCDPGHGRTPLDAATESISTCSICRASAWGVPAGRPPRL